MKILLVDDDNDKARDVSRVLLEAGVHDQRDIEHVTNAYDAAQALRRSKFDLLILDLVIPNTKTDDPKADGGKLLLRDINGRPGFIHPTYIIGLTSFDDARENSTIDFNRGLWTIIKFDRSSSDWIDMIRSRIRYIQSSEAATTAGANYGVDLAVVCALREPELRAVLGHDYDWQKTEKPLDPTIYWKGTWQDRKGNLRTIVAASAGNMGLVAASSLTAKMAMHFRPRVIGMCGICAGREGDTELGDVIVANPSWDYGSGKFSNGDGGSDFAPHPTQIPLSPTLRRVAEMVADDGSFLDSLRRSYSGSPPKTALKLRIGPMASGAAVRADDSFFEELAKANRKVLAVEMEAYGVFATANEMPSPRADVLVVKGVSDFANSNKEDSFQDYAAYVSSACLLEMIERHFSE
ncbi:hypothetical protein [Mesorhizobium sp. CO1-1-8]|uniref:phosphorylase family protein n=1 Tax=Mesorhizobium sp. CO1-1-8 TaxID=2876631 RepID=UPI001CD0F3EA|nr:hypothetical protein [Mesorhizobium sp. CO1-1-8]MBZ9775380.1 hypothetical protein [Mesorhizobium sp. CO1-1-8]